MGKPYLPAVVFSLIPLDEAKGAEIRRRLIKNAGWETLVETANRRQRVRAGGPCRSARGRVRSLPRPSTRINSHHLFSLWQLHRLDPVLFRSGTKPKSLKNSDRRPEAEGAEALFRRHANWRMEAGYASEDSAPLCRQFTRRQPSHGGMGRISAKLFPRPQAVAEVAGVRRGC